MSNSFNLSKMSEAIIPDFGFKTKHLQLELLPQKVVLQADGVGGLNGLHVDDGGDEEEEEERHPHSDVVNWGLSPRTDSTSSSRKHPENTNLHVKKIQGT